MTLLEALADIRSWNNADLRNLDEISPNEPMLKARRKVINVALAKAKRALQYVDMMAGLDMGEIDDDAMDSAIGMARDIQEDRA